MLKLAVKPSYHRQVVAQTSDGTLVITARSCLKPAVMTEFHHQFMIPALMTDPINANSNPTPLQTSGEGGFGSGSDGGGGVWVVVLK